MKSRTWGAIALVCSSSMALGFFEGTAWERVAKEKGVDPYILYSVALAETKAPIDNSSVAPHLYTLRADTEVWRYESEHELRSGLKAARTRYEDWQIDVGVCQVNLHWQAGRVANVEDLANPEQNLSVAAEVLAEAISSSPDDLVLGVGRYHHWKDEEVSRDYGRKVLEYVRALKHGETND